MEVAPCYPGNPSDLLAGECRFGVTRCVAGVVRCVGAVTPKPEVCDGVDQDCDGQVDEGLSRPLDIVFVIDNSASMYYHIGHVRDAINANALDPRGDQRWALMGAPAPNVSGWWSTRPQPLLDFTTDPVKLRVAVNAQDGFSGVGEEPTLDALFELSMASNPHNLTWRPGSTHLVVMLTDEYPQEYYADKPYSRDAGTVPTSVIVYTLHDVRDDWQPYGSVEDIWQVQNLRAALQFQSCR